MAQSYLVNLKSLCYGCMSNNDGLKLQTYYIQNEALQTIIQCEEIILCYLCQRVAQQAEQFIYNVQHSQVWLETKKEFSDTEVQTIKAIQGIRPLVNLSFSLPSQEDIIALSGTNEKEFCLEEVKLEFDADIEDTQNITKQENIGETIEQGCQNIDETTKQETINIIESQVAQHNITDVFDDPLSDNSLSDKNGHKSEDENCTENKTLTPGKKFEWELLTKEQFREELIQKAQEEKYLEAPFKCVDCVRHYRMKDTYERHMELHKETNGAHECDLCKQRMTSNEQLINHIDRHLLRFKCGKCGLVTKDRKQMKEHYRIVHEGRNDNICTICKKLYSCKATLKYHMKMVHSTKLEPTKCHYCGKLFKNKNYLPEHLLVAHSEEVSAKRHTCELCGRSYIHRNQLKRHAQTHFLTNEHYCVECDKTFKTESSLQIHLKTAAAHFIVTDLSLTCPQCGKQFTTKRACRDHVKRIHDLVVKNFQCAHCDKVYATKATVGRHIRMVHEKFVPPRKFSCKFCDKAFMTTKELENHIRTHTGERPFKCSKCSAEFTHSGSLHNHNKIVHLGLKRKKQLRREKTK